MTDRVSPQKFTSFEIELDKFQFEIMEKWFGRTRHEIGISIQKLDDMQDASNPTRIGRTTNGSDPTPTGHTATKRINFFCKKIQEQPGNLVKCNSLDTSLKAIANSTGFPQLNYACRCHAGVSNVLIPYRHPKDKERVWYVFIGQFLLKQEASTAVQRYLTEEFHTQNFSLLETKDIPRDHQEFVQADIFIPKAIYRAFGGENGHISYISATELFMFREFALTELEGFLNHFYATEPGRKQIADWCEGGVRPSQRLLQDVEEFQRWLISLPFPPAFERDLKKVLDSISKHANIGAVSRDDVDVLGKWLNEGVSGGQIQSRAWLAKGASLVKCFDNASHASSVSEGKAGR